MKALLLFLAAPLALAGCTTGPIDAGRTVTYLCDNGPALTVTFTGDTARIRSPDGDIVLQQARSGSGFRYESATHSLRGKGDEVTYTVGRRAPMTCRVARPEPR